MKKTLRIVYVILLALYLTTSYFVSITARNNGSMMVLGTELPAVSFTGVLSMLGNILLIIMVVFLKKRGFITALVLLILQLPMLFRGFFVSRNVASLPGIFGIFFTIFAIIAIYRRNRKIQEYQDTEVRTLRSQQQFSQRLFEQTATALVNAVDAKDTYSHGHSIRVAEYSEKIARIFGKNDEECYKIYYTALLHDVGKIGIPNHIINKKGKLEKDEYEIIKQHPVTGNQILSSINEYPYLAIGAHYHHERYDGKGYPDGLKGEDIPEIARIISVADAYDAMSSSRSYRDAIPQQLIREEIIKGAGTQFDPKLARIMQQLIDEDPEYKMREQSSVSELAGRSELCCKEFRSEISEGIVLNANKVKIHLRSALYGSTAEGKNGPAMILFDSLDGRFHDDSRTAEELNYYEYCLIWMDGRCEQSGVRKIEETVTASEREADDRYTSDSTWYDIEAVKVRDHVLVKIDNGEEVTEVTVALPDSTRFVYLSLTGQNCIISEVAIDRDDDTVPDDYITRIAEEVSFIKGTDGDIPSVQVDGYRTDSTEAIPITNDMKIRYHTMSLPTARLIWHCAFLVIYSSKDKKVNGEGYKEYALIRTDGESWESEGISENKLVVNKQDDFEGWDAWKEGNKKGIDCVALVERKDNKIIVTLANLGILIRNTTTILDGTEDLYISLTGDQCAITNIRIEN